MNQRIGEATKSDVRYPYTYAYDYLRMAIADTYDEPMPSRAAMAKVVSEFADCIGVDNEQIAMFIADQYLEKYGK